MIILQQERILHCNNVRRLSGLWTSVGQLVLFIIGGGGLILVGSRWSIRLWVKWRNGAGSKSGWARNGLLSGEDDAHERCEEAFGLDEDVRGGYVSWRATKQDQRVLKAEE